MVIKGHNEKHFCLDASKWYTTYKTIVFTTSPVDLMLNGIGYLFYFTLFPKAIMKKIFVWTRTIDLSLTRPLSSPLVQYINTDVAASLAINETN